jgi:hypothetical protein
MELSPTDLTQQRQQARALLDVLPAEKLTAVRSLLEVMVDPVARAVALAPPEDEEISEEEERAVAQAHEWLKHNKPIPHEEVLAEFGLTMADFERMGRTPCPPEPNRSNH